MDDFRISTYRNVTSVSHREADASARSFHGSKHVQNVRHVASGSRQQWRIPRFGLPQVYVRCTYELT
ncbi:unnamed protein product [Arctia plantaginis]|uniref:Uncharacterized protein n=1 Tax=Arctia plantaginis TaxID=874455 RepID=A0A8S1BCI7_ARCPL|nr:unnamed protein product [Arctia plantaginis]